MNSVEMSARLRVSETTATALRRIIRPEHHDEVDEYSLIETALAAFMGTAEELYQIVLKHRQLAMRLDFLVNLELRFGKADPAFAKAVKQDLLRSMNLTEPILVEMEQDA